MNSIISEQKLFEYINCPLRYSFICNGFKSTDSTFNKKVYGVVKSLYLSTLDKTYSTVKPMQNKWDKICEQEQMNPKKALEGLGHIISAFNYIDRNRITFSDVDSHYTLEVPGSKIIVQGQLDPFIDKGDHIEVIISHFGKKQPDIADINKKLKHTIDAYVLKKKYNKDVIFKYVCFTTGNEYITLRNTRDFNRLEKIITEVGKAINDNIIYPRETFMCSSCCYLDLCGAWGND